MNRALVRLLPALAVAVLVLRCGSKPPGPPPATDAGPGTDTGVVIPAGDGGFLTGGDGGLQADGSTGCGLRTCESAGATCGPIGDGCGGVIQCGTCAPPQTCGGGGVPSQCGGTEGCTPRTCASEGWSCGLLGDGCGNLLDCGTCPPGAICGGDDQPGQCVGGTSPDGGVACTNLCLQQVTCPDNGTTSVSGTVFAPNGNDPLYNALVYVPNGTVEAFTPGVSCLKCGGEVSGTPLVSAYTGPDGTFTLRNMPVGTDIPLVIQLGRWRRQITIPNVAQCVDTALAPEDTRLPRNRTEGDIPLTAMVTGDVDALECVLRKIGIADSEFTNPGGGGRIHLYRQNGAVIDGNTPRASTLWNDPSRLDDYDLVLFACEGRRNDKSDTALANLVDYADKGGRVYTTHYSYVWLYDNTPWGCGNQCTSGPRVANWHINQPGSDSNPLISTVDTSFPKGLAFSQWLDAVGSSTAPGSNQLEINIWRHNFDGLVPPTQRWLYTTSPDLIQHFTFNTPVGAAPEDQCGRVLFSDFHVENAADLDRKVFPTECSGTTLSPQEKVLEFMLFDLASCLAPDKPVATCTPRTCADFDLHCGPAGDGCGNRIECGDCTPPQTCGGGGVPGVCGEGSCVPTTCAAANAECGAIADGCGGLLECGTCPAPRVCGGGGVANRCSGDIN